MFTKWIVTLLGFAKPLAAIALGAVAVATGAEVACAEDTPIPSLEVFVPEGAALFRIPDSRYSGTPVRCGSSIVAFPASEMLDHGQRDWIRFYNIERHTSTDEDLRERDGGIIACNLDGTERTAVLWQSDAQSVGDFTLVSTDGKRTTELLSAAKLFSVDGRLRTFIFGRPGKGDPDRSGRLELVTVDFTGDHGIRVRRTQKFGNASPDSVTAAAISADDKTIAYSVRTTADRTRWNDPSALDLIVSPFGQRAGVRLPMDRLLKAVATVKTFFFDQNKLVVVGLSDDKKIVVATCVIEVNAPRGCKSILTGLDDAKFEFLGLGQTGFIFGGGDPRACIFETSAPQNNDVPSACRTGGAPGPRYCGLCDPIVTYVISPDRQHAVVRSKHQGDGLSGFESEWAIVPMAIYRAP